MPPRPAHASRRSRIALLGALLVLASALTALVLAPGSGASQSLQSRIDATRGKLSQRHGRAQVLTSDLTRFSHRIAVVQGSITKLEGRLAVVQSDLDAKQGELFRIRSGLRTAQARLVRLRTRLALARRTLAARMVQMWESDQPDLLTVVLNARGFADLLEQTQFLNRLGSQDKRVIAVVSDAGIDAAATAKRLKTLEARQQTVTAAVLARRNEVAGVRAQLVSRRSAYAQVRDAKASALAGVRQDENKLRGHLDFLESEQRRIAGQLAGGSGPLPAGPIKPGSGGLIWPVNGPITSPFCERRAWEACHPGIDIGVPTGTSIRAAANGTVRIAGWVGGYGNYTCIQHAGPLSTCYGHQERILVSVGQSVRQGQVIGISDCTGLCFGPHLHFETRINGTVVNPMNYL